MKVGLYDGIIALVEKPVIQVPLAIQELAQSRRQAKKTKDFALADAIRDELLHEGWEVVDTKGYYII